MKKRWIFFLCLVIFSLFSGCGRVLTQKGVASHIVCSIHLQCENCSDIQQREFSDPEAIRLILLCLRSIGPDFPAPEDVESLGGQTITLSLHLADGTEAVYRIKNNRYLQKNGGSWRKISAEGAEGLYQLLLLIPQRSAHTAYLAPGDCSHAYRVYCPALRRLRKL